MKLIYIDEAGISAREPNAIVCGLIVDPDTQWRAIIYELGQLLKEVPEEFRANFIFHATDIWNDHKYRDKWAFDKRVEFLLSLMRLPAKLGISISAGVVNENNQISKNPFPGTTPEQMRHTFAFVVCLGNADKIIREVCHPIELAVVVAEDAPKMHARLKAALWSLRGKR